MEDSRVTRGATALVLVLALGGAVACADRPAGRPLDASGKITDASGPSTDPVDAPQVVLDAALTAVPGGTIREVEQETAGGVVVYEAEVSAPDGQVWDLSVDSQGKVLQKELADADEDGEGGSGDLDDEVDSGTDHDGVVAPGDIPAAVLDAIAAAVDGGSIERVEVDTEDGAEVYEAEVRATDGRVMDVEVDAAGNVLEIEADDDHGEALGSEDTDDIQDEVEQDGEHED